MLTALALSMVLSCKRPPHPLPEPEVVQTVSSACEGNDRVERNVNGFEVRRFTDACRPAPRPTPTHRQDVWKFGLSAR
jgi:hypothetical protein